MTYQRIEIIGHLGKDPEKKIMKDGNTSVTNFSVAVTKTTGKGENKKKVTTWFDCAAWSTEFNKLGDVAYDYLKSGSQVYIAGEVSSRAYMNNKGEPASAMTITVDTLKMLGSAGDESGTRSKPAPVEAEEEMPF